MGSAWDNTPSAPARASAPASAAGGAASAPALSAWDSTSAPTPEAPPRSFLGSLGDLVSAVGHHVMAPLHGSAQFIENSVAAGANKLPENPVSRAIVGQAQADNQAVAQWEKDYQASTPDGWGANTGAVVGSVAPLLLGAVPNALERLGGAVASRVAPTAAGAAPSLVARTVSGATQGAVLGAAQPVTTAPTTLSDLVTQDKPDDFWAEKLRQVEGGAAFGGALPGIGSGIGAAVKSARQGVQNSAILNPSTYAAKQLAIQLGADAPTVASNLATAPTYVPGSMPTAAQAGADPRLVMMEKGLANQNPKFKAALAARENANNAARLEAVGNVAQTPQALADAITQRTTVTAPMRDFTVTNGNPVPVSSIDQALGALQGGPLGVRPTIGNAAGAMRSELGDLTNVTPPNTLTNTPGAATASPAMLDALRQNANDYLSKFAPQGFVGTQEQAAMTPVKSAIIDAIDAANPGHKLSAGGWGQGLPQVGPQAPGYRDYLAEFAKRSVPINTMEVGQQLQAKLLSGALNSTGEASATLPGYRSALAQALRNSDYAIDPQAQAALEGVQSDLQRSTISNSIKTGGSDTAYNEGAGQSFLDAVGAGKGAGNGKAAAVGLGTLLTTGNPFTASGAMNAVKNVGGWTTNRVGNALGDLLLDPQKLADALNASAKPAAAAAPTTFDRLLEQMSPRAKALAISQLLQQQAPQVVAPDPQRQQASQR